jgi:thiol-disulfide isomerase/thioredoxin
MKTVMITRPGGENFATAEAAGESEYELRLPPGTYVVTASGFGNAASFENLTETIEIAEDETDLELHFELTQTAAPAAAAASPAAPSSEASAGPLIGNPAPSFQSIKAWKNGGPVTMEELKGKVVLLDFWGYWCGPCIMSMPRLMAMHDAFAEHGLVVIGVHEGSLATMEELPPLLADAKARVWGGRDIPFLIALDGGASPIGDTNEAYQIRGWPTSYLVDKEGKVAKSFHPSSPEAWADIEELLGVKVEEPRAPAAQSPVASLPPAAGSQAQAAVGGQPPVVAPDWLQRLSAAYEITDGEDMKYIYPPFMSARDGLFEASMPNRAGRGESAPAFFVLAMEDKTADAWPISGFAQMDLAPLSLVLEHVVGLEPWQFGGDERVLNTDLMGDWILRRSASKEERIQALEKLLRDTLGFPVRFEEREVDRDAVNVSGSYEPITSMARPLAVRFQGSLAQLMERLSRETGLPFIDETDSESKDAVSCLIDVAAVRRAEPSSAEFDSAVEALLQDISQQMGITFTRAERRVTIWYAKEER